MHLFDWVHPLYSIAGFFVGTLVGMTGVGGGALMTPLLILLFGIHPAVAVGTDLFYAAATKSAGTFVHGFNRNVDWRVVRRLAAGSVPATALTILIFSRLDIRGDALRDTITPVLGAALLVTAMSLFFRNAIAKLHAAYVGELGARDTRNLTIATGAVLGVLVTISSVGAGAIGVTILILLYPRMSAARIVGSDIAHAVPLTLVAGSGHWLLGSIDWPLFGSLLVGSLPGIFVGSQASVRIPEVVLRPILATTLVVASGKLVF